MWISSGIKFNPHNSGHPQQKQISFYFYIIYVVLMFDFLSLLYPWTKALHVISVIAWMAGLLYLPRLFVYHVETDDSLIKKSETIVRWELLLMKRIINPAMGATWLFGILLVLTPGVIDWSMGWVHVKALMVILLSACTGFLSKERRLLSEGKGRFTGKQYRLINEIPTVLMIIIVVMVIVRPF